MEWNWTMVLFFFWPLVLAALVMGFAIFCIAFWLCRRHGRLSKPWAAIAGIALVVASWIAMCVVMSFVLCGHIYGP